MPTDLRLWPRLFLAIVVAIATLPLGAMPVFADHVEPADEMFFYRASDGLFRYYDVSSDGRIGSPVLAGDGYTRGWSSVSAVDLDGDGQDEMFSYRASDGLFRYCDVSSDGRIGSPVLAGDGYTRGWTSITAVDLDEDRCAENPFTASRVSALEARYPGQSFTAYAYDTAGRSLTSWELGQLEPMITESANTPVRSLWRSFGGSPWFARQAEIFGLDQTNAVGDTGGVWGRTTTSARDQSNLIRQVLLGHWGPLDEVYRQEAWDLMTSVVPSQSWGITAGVPSGWTIAQKNGFAGHITNSVGFVQQPGSEDGYVIAILSNGWPTWENGVPAVEEIARWVSSSLAH